MTARIAGQRYRVPSIFQNGYCACTRYSTVDMMLLKRLFKIQMLINACSIINLIYVYEVECNVPEKYPITNCSVEKKKKENRKTISTDLPLLQKPDTPAPHPAPSPTYLSFTQTCHRCTVFAYELTYCPQQ